MHPPSTLVYLERPWNDASGVDTAVLSAAFLMGLRYPGEYWVELAVQWAELGFPITGEAASELKRIAGSSPKQFSQQLRHRVAALLRHIGASVAAQQVAPAEHLRRQLDSNAGRLEQMSHRKLLVLDLDETLIHATEQSLEREADFMVGKYHVYARPYLKEFLQYAFREFDVGVWTSAGAQYAKDIVSEVFKDTVPLFLFSSLRCTLRRNFNTNEYVPVKRLSKLKSMGYRLEQIIAIDDTPEKHKENYGNLVHIQEYKGEANDAELPLLSEYLGELAREPNIRAVEKRGWRSRVLQAKQPGT